jgi:hypothetical protein
MCGISGFIGIKGKAQRELVDSLGLGIDMRGGDASGYISVASHGAVTHAKKLGTWTGARNRFRRRCSGDIVMMHARWATCGSKFKQDQAHPFEIRRDRKTVLWGAHNGCIWNADDSAKLNGRPYTVDSKELFNLLADGDIRGINNLDGYGVITWYAPGEEYVNMARLSDSSEICVVQVVGGGLAWASTWAILGDALEYAGLEADYEFNLDEIGRVYQMSAEGVVATSMTGLKLSEQRQLWKEPESWESEMIAKMMAEQDKDEEVEDDRDRMPAVDEHLRSRWERDTDDEDGEVKGYPSMAEAWNWS